jgi:hypothetical protein
VRLRKPPRVAPPGGARGIKIAPPPGAPRPGLPGRCRRWPSPRSGVPGSRVGVDRLVGATAVGSGETEPAGSGRGGGYGGSPASPACWSEGGGGPGRSGQRGSLRPGPKILRARGENWNMGPLKNILSSVSIPLF